MAVHLMIGEVPNLTEEIYSGMLEQMKNHRYTRPRDSSPTPAGHIRTAGGEWSKCGECKRTASHGSTEDVKPNLPPDVVPTRTLYALHSACTASRDTPTRAASRPPTRRHERDRHAVRVRSHCAGCCHSERSFGTRLSTRRPRRGARGCEHRFVDALDGAQIAGDSDDGHGLMGRLLGWFRRSSFPETGDLCARLARLIRRTTVRRV